MATSGFSDYFWGLLIDAGIRAETPSFPASWWIGFSSTVVDDETNITEVPFDFAYERLEVTASSISWDPPEGGGTVNTSILTWPTATGDWGDLVSVIAYDSDTGGNLLAWGAISPINVEDGITVVYAPGELFLGR